MVAYGTTVTFNCTSRDYSIYRVSEQAYNECSARVGGQEIGKSVIEYLRERWGYIK